MALERALKQRNPVSPIIQLAPASKSAANGKRDRAPELMRGRRCVRSAPRSAARKAGTNFFRIAATADRPRHGIEVAQKYRQ
ncbi:MAG: hypothetical protein VCC99_13445, partial [Alphaproteobacteria bacterium]